MSKGTDFLVTIEKGMLRKEGRRKSGGHTFLDHGRSGDKLQRWRRVTGLWVRECDSGTVFYFQHFSLFSDLIFLK